MENEQHIKIDVFVNEKDYRRALFWYSRNTFLLILLTLFFSIPVFLYLLGFEGVKSLNTDSLSNILILGLIVLFDLFLIALLFLLYSIWKQSKQLSKVSEETRFNFSESGMESKCKLCSSKMTWERITKVCETKIDFVVFPQENMFYPIPKRLFESKTQIGEFKKLVKQKLGDKAELLN
jgi:hypothetical protein